MVFRFIAPPPVIPILGGWEPKKVTYFIVYKLSGSPPTRVRCRAPGGKSTLGGGIEAFDY